VVVINAEPGAARHRPHAQVGGEAQLCRMIVINRIDRRTPIFRDAREDPEAIARSAADQPAGENATDVVDCFFNPRGVGFSSVDAAHSALVDQVWRWTRS